MVSAAGMCRDRGRVVAVGFVPFGLPREIAFAKELDLRIARSYGPGRYDAGYEEKGLDYPLAYVRWTETRNLEAFLGLLADGSVRLGSLVTHRTNLDDAPRLYDALVDAAGDRPLGVVIDYPEAPVPGEAPAVRPPRVVPPSGGKVGVAFVGAGGFARAVLLPALAKRSDVRLVRVATQSGLSAHDARAKFGFDAIGTDPDEVFSDPAIDLVCVATRHDSHADLVARALRAGKHVFVEKPLALDEDGLSDVLEAAASSVGTLSVGFNRRFAPMAVAAREVVAARGPALITCRVNAGALPAGHWLNDPEVGGGRMVGEGCHFVDLVSFLAGDPEIADVQAIVAGGRTPVAEDFAVQIAFADGSAGQILYTARGGSSLPKERIELHAGGASVVVDDWMRAEAHVGGRRRKIARPGKGHREELAAVLGAILEGREAPVPTEVLARVTRATFTAHRLLSSTNP
jgi:predicted dehydrogenase